MAPGPNSVEQGRDPWLARAKRRLGPVLNVPQVNALRGVPLPTLTGQAAQDRIAEHIAAGGRLVARVGETEARATVHYLRRRWGARRPAPYDPGLARLIKFGTGCFPTDAAALDRLGARHRAATQAIDLYAAWTPHDRWLLPRGAERCRLVDLEPFFAARPWTLALAGRRVAVVSPFKASIEAQFARRAELFARPLLPDFELHAIRAAQTNCDVDVRGQDWAANLAAMDAAVAASGAEVVIIGAGSYSLPLAASAKARGTTAIVTGGVTQLLFGIMGNRWLELAPYRALMTPAWVRPGAAERPPGHERFEMPGGAHW